MRFFIIGFVIAQIPAHLRAEHYGAHFPPRRNEKQISQSSESRYHSSPEHPSGEYSDYDDRIKGYDLPTTFKAPPYEAHDHWKNDRNHYERRTFFDDFSRGPYDKTTVFPSIHRFMSSLFGGGDESDYPQDFRYDRNRVTPPYKLATPFVYSPTEPNYIPPPKPIRASVIKLETITRSPVYPPFDYETTASPHSHVGGILNHELVGNSKPRRNVTWPEENVNILPFKPLPVLPKPAFSPPTVLAPTHPEYFDNGTRFTYRTDTDYKYPESVQDQLPHLRLENAEIPYVSEKPIPQIFVTLPAKPPPLRQTGHAVEFSPPGSRPTTTVFEPFDIRSLNAAGTNPNRRERPVVNFDATTVKSFPGAVEKVKRPTFKYTKKLTAQLDKSPVERVTNLTVSGLSKTETEKANDRRQSNFLNVRELTKLLNITNEDVTARRTFNSSLRPVNFNDELSLDAKILRDTNWDGLTVLPTLSEDAGTTPVQVVPRVEPKPNTTAFWEIVDEQTTFPSTNWDSPETTTAVDQIRFQTTTEFAFWSSTPHVVETTEPAIIEETTQRRGDRRSETAEDPSKSRKDESGLQNRVTFKRKYSRRPKIVNFTPYPTADEIPKKLANRSHFAKRQKPNITLAFGNKNVLKNKSSSGTDEVMKFSDEDVRKRRKIGKRRQVYKRIRVRTTTGPPNHSDQL